MTISQNYTTQEQVNEAFLCAWMDYNKEAMKRLITDPNLSFHFNMNYSHPQGHKYTGATHFMEVCAKGDLEFVQFILTNQNVKNKISINDNGWYDSPLSYAVMSGNLELVKYMLTSDLPEKAQIMHKHVVIMRNDEGQIVKAEKVENWPLEMAFQTRNLQMIDFLLASPELTEHAKLTPEIMHEYSEHVELMNFIQQKGYIVEEHDSSYYARDKTGNLVKMKF